MDSCQIRQEIRGPTWSGTQEEVAPTAQEKVHITVLGTVCLPMLGYAFICSIHKRDKDTHRLTGRGRLPRAQRRRLRRLRASGCSPPMTPSVPSAIPAMHVNEVKQQPTTTDRLDNNESVFFKQPAYLQYLRADRAPPAVRARRRHNVRADDCTHARTCATSGTTRM